MTHPWQWSATTALAQTRSNKVSCREIAVATLERIAAVNPSVNALTRVLGDEALFAADRADAAQQRGEPGGPMHGVTVTTKINTDQVGAPTDDGLLRFASRMPTEDSPAVARLRAAGALLIGRSNSPAMGLAQNTGNDLHGLTLNPWTAPRLRAGPAAVPRWLWPPGCVPSHKATISPAHCAGRLFATVCWVFGPRQA